MGDGGVACAPSQRATERFVHTEARCKAFAPKPFGRMRKGEQASEPDRKEELGMEKGRRLEGKTERSELEKGEFPAERHQKEGVEPGEWRNEDSKKGGFVLESWWKGDRERKQEREKDGSGWSDQRHRTRHSSKLEVSSHERDRKSCSRANEEEWSQYKYEHNNGRSHGKDSCSGSWPKWPSMESESSSFKHHEEFSGFSGLKSRHISGERNWSNHSEKSSTNISSSSSRVLSAYRHSSSRNHESRLVRSPGHTDPPSYDRAHRHDYRDRASRLHERSPHDRARHHHLKDIFPIYLELSPHDGSRAMEQREQNRKCYVSENLQNSRNDEKLLQRNSIGRDTHKNSSARTSNNSSSSRDRSADDKCIKERKSLNFSEEPSESPPPPPPPPFPLPQVNGRIEEQPSMEEDMDICDTPPHVAEQADTNLGKWCYLDHFGVERGTTKLADLKRLVEEGILLSDHLIKHADSNRWVTIENATSPLVSLNLPSIVSDAVTWKVSPPEAAGKFSVDTDFSHEEPISLTRQELHPDHSSVSPEFIEDLRIDERVAALLNGYTVTRGKELESIGEALKSNFVYTDLEKWDQSEGFTRSRPRAYDLSTHVRDGKRGRAFEGASKEAAQTRLGPSYEKENLVLSVESTNWFDGRWSCKGGDWKGNDEASQGRSFKTRQVLNEGFPLCLRTKSWCEDPRGHRKDDLYQTPYIRKLDLPPWAFTWTEDKNEGDTSEIVANGFGQIKPSVTKAVKGTLLPVIKINAHVVKDQGTVEPRIRLRSSEHHTPRSSRSYSSSGDKTWLSDTSFHSKKPCEHDLQSMHKCTTVLNAPKDHVCTVDELSLHLGNWYYLDGAGHEHGPSTYAELEELAAKGTILKHSSVFRKDDNMWFPITSNARAIGSVHNQEENLRVHSCSADCHSLAHSDISTASRSFHNSHPQFIGYTRGKLHELIMKFYKNREFAAAINQVLDPWMSLRQPTNEMDKHLSFNSSIMKSSAVLTHDSSVNEFWKSEDGSGTANNRPGKRARLLSDESVGGFEMKEDICQEHESSFDDLLCESAFPVDNVGNPEAENESWSLLNVHVLARIFHFLRKDVKSLLFAGATCKCWKSAIIFYKGIANQVDFSSIGANCTDCMVRSIMNGYEKKSIRSVVLAGCSNVSVNLLKDILRLFPFMASIDIRGCSQFKNVDFKYQNVKWLKDINSPETNNLEESHSKIRSLLQIRDKSCSLSNDSKGLSSNLGKSDEHFGFFKKEPYSGRKDTSSHPLRQGYYNGKRLDDARKSSAAVSRSSHMRQLMLSNQYKEMEEFIASSLNDIVRKNPLEFFRVKVAQIEDRMRSGFYARSCGLDTVKEDIRRMCWDALKIKNQGSAAEMNQLMMSFMQLLKSLDENPKSSFERDEKIRPLKNDSGSRLNSSISKYGRKVSKTLSEKGGMNKGNNKFYDNGRTDYGTYVFECEGKRKLSKLKKMDSDSEISDDLSGDVKGADERNNSDTESDLDIHSRAGIGDVKGIQYSMMDETLDSISDDREWGARMTKAGLVPPVTRKYEVIDRYVIVADADEVRKKMQVSLPEDYAEKLVAQKSSKQESDMELPEVKEYKPRKVLGEEVLEQEVYGIDPYTHNLLFDSMPEEQECPIVDKHKFIEEVLLCALNKQVRPFTGCGNTPMVYPLQPVIKQIRETAEEEGDIHVMKICLAILKAIQNRPDDNYVAYRKGLGVVCNKEEGFGVDDFVVEFLGEVYPVWRWYEKQDGIRSLQKNNKDPVPEFYNINLERPKGDRDGYDLVVVDAMHKANYASRICHSCRPNCEAKLTAVDGQYQIGIYTVRPISYGEEVTFDYNSVTESKDEYEASVCLCGSQVCRGSYLNLTGEGAFQKVLKDCHGMLDRHKLMLEACEVNFVSQEDYIDLRTAGLGNCLLSGLPDWLVTYSAHLVRFINLERTMLPEEILKHNVEEKKKFFSDICLEIEKHDAEVQAEGVYNARLQNIAITLDKVRHVMTCVFGNAKTAPPPLKKLNPEAAVSVLWKGEGSLVEELLQCMAPHMEENFLETLKSKIHAHDPSGSGDLQKELKKSLLWLRDELRNLPCTYKCRHDAAADLIHLYAYTKCFFKIQEYKTVKSPPVYISPLDLGPKHANKMESGFQEYCKTYGENYCLGQLIYWHCQTNVDPDCHLSRARRGCLSLPDVSSFYAKSQKSLHEHVYGSRTMRFMLSRMERQPQRPWPRDRLWVFKGSPKFFGSPMLDAVLNKCPLDKEMVHWLRSRPNVFHGT